MINRAKHPLHLLIAKMKSVLFLLIFFSTFSTKACDCPPATLKDDIKNATVLFSGKVITISPYKTLKPGVRDSDVIYHAVAVKFRVDQQWKGKPTKEITIITGVTGMQGDDCAYIFKKGVRYLVFAFTKDRSGVFGDSSGYLFSDKNLFTDCCSHTDLLIKAKHSGIINQL